MEDNKNLNTNTEIQKTEESSAVNYKKETTKTDVTTDKTNEKTFTQEEIEKIISKRLERERKKAEVEKQEAEKLAKMSEAERQQAIFEKEKAKFEEERKYFEKQQLELQVIKELNNKNLPSEFSKYLIGNNVETCMTNIKEFETQWQNVIEKTVQERLKGGSYTPPKTNEENTINPYLEETFNLTKQMELEMRNPELAKKLKGQANK